MLERSTRAVLAFVVMIGATAHSLVSLSASLSPQFFVTNFGPTLRHSVDGCEYLLWSDLPGDLGNDHARAAVARGIIEVVERKADVTLAKRRAEQ